MPLFGGTVIGGGGGGSNLTTKGDLETFISSPVRFGVAPAETGKVLTQDVSTATGLIWKTPVGSFGGLLTNDGTKSAVLPKGTDGQLLSADSTASLGIKWSNNPLALLTEKSQFLTRTDTAFTTAGVQAGQNGFVLTANSLQDNGLEFKEPKVELINTKGGLLSSSGAELFKLPVGTNGQLLTADSNESLGLKWINEPVGVLTTKGDLITRTESTIVREPVGANGQVLTADSNNPNGLIYTTPKNPAVTYGNNLSTCFNRTNGQFQKQSMIHSMNTVFFPDFLFNSNRWTPPVNGIGKNWKWAIESINISGGGSLSCTILKDGAEFVQIFAGEQLAGIHTNVQTDVNLLATSEYEFQYAQVGDQTFGTCTNFWTTFDFFPS